MLPQRGASSDRQETQHPVQANHLQVNAPAQEVRLPNPVITPRPLPPIPLLPPEVDGNSVDHSIHNPQLCAYSAPFPPTFRPSLTYSAADLNVYSDVTDLARRDLRGQKKQIQAQNTCEEAGKRLSERALVVTSHIHMPRPLPCPPKAAIAINRSFEEHLNDTASRHGGASYALSPKCPATPTPLSPLNPFDVRLRMDQQIPWCTTIADSRRNVLTSTSMSAFDIRCRTLPLLQPTLVLQRGHLLLPTRSPSPTHVKPQHPLEHRVLTDVVCLDCLITARTQQLMEEYFIIFKVTYLTPENLVCPS